MAASSKQINLVGMRQLTVSARACRSAGQLGILRRFANDRSGTVVMLYALVLIPLVASVGLAVDFGRAYHASSKTQAALDAAALAAGRVAQVETTDRVSKASAAARAFFDQAKPTNVITSSLEFSPNSQLTEFKLTATSWMSTPFLGVLNVLFHQGAEAGAPATCAGNYFACVKLAATATAELTLGRNEGAKLEVSLMLDVTGSMSGQKILDLKTAAKDLIDIVVWDDQSKYSTKVALAPFANAVRPGPLLLPQVRRVGAATNRFKDNEGRWQVYKLTDCVSERDGPGAYTDLAPIDNDRLGPVYTRSGFCDPLAEVVPLTPDKVLLKARIDSLMASGWTAGHLGTAWAWYLISPNWASVLPSQSAPASYGDKSVRKIAILMTDGEYNVQYDASGIATRENGGGAPMNGLSDAQARQVCDNMKAKGIEVYTVAFDLREAKAIETMRRCATDTSHFYLAENGDQLLQAYRDIALKISRLVLTN